MEEDADDAADGDEGVDGNVVGKQRVSSSAHSGTTLCSRC